MASFAERIGRREVRSVIQHDDLDSDTRVELWNVMDTARTALSEKERRHSSRTQTEVLNAVWAWEFKQPADEQPSDGVIWNRIKASIIKGEWFDALDLIEQTVGYIKRYEDAWTKNMVSALVGGYNNRFEHFLVGYRFIGLEITPVDSTAEAEAVSDAITTAAGIEGARHALERAVDLLADRQNPDYPNSIKESISAVESVVKKVTGEGTLGAGLKKLKQAGVSIHPALETAWSKMYGWTSDASGIRHAGVDAADADQTIAKYMLVTCSAFVSYLIEEGRKAGLLT